mgnify:CR=1 FL=1
MTTSSELSALNKDKNNINNKKCGKERCVIVQCRLSSTRLPGKALKKIQDRTVLSWTLRAMKKVPAERYFVATDKDSFDSLQSICFENGFEIFAGDLNDVLKRFCDLISSLNGIKTIIRATADNPFLFYEAAKASVEEFEQINQASHCDYLTYSGLPHGSGVEIFSAEALLKAASQTDSPYDHEHVGPALYKHTDKFECRFVPAPREFCFPELRTTIDTYSDHLRSVQLAEYVCKCRSNKKLKIDEAFSCAEILNALEQKLIQNPLVLVPSVKKGHGTGHLRRCLSIALKTDFFVYIPSDADLEELPSLFQEAKLLGLKDFQIIHELPDETYAPIICTDTFRLEQNQLELFSKAKKIISLDEGSEFSEVPDYLLDIIPSAVTREEVREPNFFNPSFIERPKNVRSKAKNVKECQFKKLLICIGGEDPRGFSIPCLKFCTSIFPDSEITLVSTKINKNEAFFKDEIAASVKIRVFDSIPNLREKLFEYDLVITHYGLTAYEAAFAGCAVLLLPTTPLHKKLAQNYGFAFVEDEDLSKAAIEAAIKKAVEEGKAFPKLSADFSDEKISLPDFIKEIAEGTRLTCPVCQKKNASNAKNTDKIVARNLLRTYRRCSECSMLYLSFSAEQEKLYHKAYFFEEYKNQYGKTYKEDFENIKNQCLRRVDEICSLNPAKTVLDIGCAYGPFLSAADDKGFFVYGTDISDDAVDYVKKSLNFPAVVSAFPDFDSESAFGVKEFDCVTMWYVIEHFKNLNSVLNKVSSLVKKGGIFAFSTPSGEGVSVKTDARNFYRISPSDHFTLWEPSRADSILRKFGFKVEKIVSTGHHPERFPEVKNSGAKKGSDEWNKIDELSHREKLGDTVEIYCRKI